MTTTQKEIERKWLVRDVNAANNAAMNKDPNRDHHYNMDKEGVVSYLIRQAYVTSNSGEPLRFRLTTSGSDFVSGEKTIKTGEGIERTEVTEQLAEEVIRPVFVHLEQNLGLMPILKLRHKIPHGKYFIEYDSLFGLPGALKQYGEYVEIEFPSVEEAEAFTDIPAWFGEEVTGQKEHNMATIFEKLQEYK